MEAITPILGVVGGASIAGIILILWKHYFSDFDSRFTELFLSTRLIEKNLQIHENKIKEINERLIPLVEKTANKVRSYGDTGLSVDDLEKKYNISRGTAIRVFRFLRKPAVGDGDNCENVLVSDTVDVLKPVNL